MGKNSILLTFVAYNIVYFDRFDVFWPNMGKTAGGLSRQILKMTWKHRFFERMDVFNKIWALEQGLFLENERFVDKIWAWEQ